MCTMHLEPENDIQNPCEGLHIHADFCYDTRKLEKRGGRQMKIRRDPVIPHFYFMQSLVTAGSGSDDRFVERSNRKKDV